ncbi:MAG TPA: alanine--tRNA ligase-related protein, partial [Bacteroidales bacterium]|nr:alanine--tRNA ligase-related protein [Bacteroidales bacterium]
EENAFLKTLSTGIKRFEQHIQANPSTRIIDGKFAFELFDTYGFPVDLTQLMAKELALEVDMDGFQKGLEGQKMRSRQATQMDTDDWVILDPTATGSFIGYDHTHSQIRIARYRQVKAKGSVSYQLVFDRTPFYAESGGQIGDTGFIESDHERIPILDTKKEGNLILHITHQLPSEPTALFTGTVDLNKRLQTARNHSATHLLHHALREVLGRHVEQKGSFVGPDHLRFDFSHFQKVSDTEIAQVEAIVNQQIRENHILQENRMIPMEKALGMGALAFFGEKYGDQVRVIRFGDSIELCGGTHVHATGQIGLFKIIAEEATAAGVRRIAAITGDTALDYLNEHLGIVRELKHLLRNSQNVIGAVHDMMDANDRLAKKLDELQREKIKHLEEHLILQAEMINGITFIGETVDLDAEGIRDLAFRLRNKVTDLFLVLGAKIENKAHLAVMISDSLVQARGFHAGKLIRDLALEIQGGGGGQPYFATAGGKFPGGLPVAIQKAKKILLTE